MSFFQELVQSPVFAWLILPLLIFLARICDVSIGTLRIILLSRGKRLLAPLLGFVEVCIWLLAISQIMQRVDNIVYFLAYAGGFAMGNYVGIRIDEKLAMGTLMVRVFLKDNGSALKEHLYEAGFGVTSMEARGRDGDVQILFSVIKRKDLNKIAEIIESSGGDVFYSVEEAKSVSRGVYPSAERSRFLPGARKKGPARQGK